jgi:tol-pal system protein YbgF
MGDSDSDKVKLRFQVRHMGKPVDPVTLLPPRENMVARLDAEDEKNTFEQAQAQFRAKNFSAAAKTFTEFLRRYPSSNYEAQAYYLLGVSFIAEGDCWNAIPMLQIVYRRFPTDQQAPDSMLNLAICQDDMYDKHAAFQTMEELIKKYPESSAAKTARGKIGILEKVTQDTGNSVAQVERQRRTEENLRQRKQPRRSPQLNMQVTHTQPSVDGSFTITVQTNADTSSLKINGNEEGGRQDGNYNIKFIARAGQPTTIEIIATDVYGNSDTKTFTVNRAIAESKVAFTPLNPVLVKRQPERDAVAIIIGISNYKTLPKAEFANDDARVFYDYAIRALGVKPGNIKLLIDQEAEDVEIIKAFKTWLPSRVKSTTDVYVFYSGHGLPTQDGQGLYLLPPRADRDFISRTSIQLQEINADLQAVKPKSVTIFMDACYSGQARTGETLVANARPVSLKAEKKLFPDHFTVITASQADQISSSSPDLKHGIFSYYLMKGMEGDADANKDGKITLGEMQTYLVENVGRQAGTMSRKQEPQLTGDTNRVLVGR